MIALVALAAFAAGVALDYATGRYLDQYKAGRYWRAGSWSAFMCLMSACGLMSAVDVSSWMLAPHCAGLIIGTVLAGRRTSR
jgi:hypothetical protein